MINASETATVASIQKHESMIINDGLNIGDIVCYQGYPSICTKNGEYRCEYPKEALYYCTGRYLLVAIHDDLVHMQAYKHMRLYTHKLTLLVLKPSLYSEKHEAIGSFLGEAWASEYKTIEKALGPPRGS
jgi:hypothetical protein